MTTPETDQRPTLEASVEQRTLEMFADIPSGEWWQEAEPTQEVIGNALYRVDGFSTHLEEFLGRLEVVNLLSPQDPANTSRSPFRIRIARGQTKVDFYFMKGTEEERSAQALYARLRQQVPDRVNVAREEIKLRHDFIEALGGQDTIPQE